jgi:hypothetical protein
MLAGMANGLTDLAAVPMAERDEAWTRRLIMLPHTLAKAGQPPPSPADHDAVVMATAAARPDLFDGSMPATLIEQAIVLAGAAADQALADRYLRIARSVVAARLRGMAMPADLRAMALLDWSPSTSLWRLLERTVINNGGPAAVNNGAAGVADRELLRHAAMVASGAQVSSIGYWLHPGEPAREFTPIVEIGDDPWEWRILATGCPLVEAMIWDFCRRDYDDDAYDEHGEYDDELFEEYAEPLRRHGVPVVRRGEPRGEVTVDPFDLWRETVQAARQDPDG